jgi:8-oxo-dGTP diphosphatase
MDAEIIHKAGGILIHDRKIMLERHGGVDTYILPGGKLEEGETPAQALIRELQEEFAISVSEDVLEAVGSFQSPAVHRPDRIVHIDAFIVKKWDGEITLHDGIEEVIWINSLDKDRLKLSSIVLQHILPLLVEKGLID